MNLMAGVPALVKPSEYLLFDGSHGEDIVASKFFLKTPSTGMWSRRIIDHVDCRDTVTFTEVQVLERF